VEWDFFGVPDPVMFQQFLDTADYWFGCSDDSSAGSYDPARECFMVTVGDLVDNTGVVGAGDGEDAHNPGTSAPRNPGPSAPPTLPTGGTDINAQLAQARELEAKLAEEYRAVRLLRACIAGEASARGERVRELGKQARERINADFNVDDPNTPPRDAAPSHARALDARGAKASVHARGARRPKGVITVGWSIEHAFDCDVECMEHAEALALDEVLVTNLEKLVNEDLDSSAKHAGSFEAAEQTKEVLLDLAAPEGRVLRVSSTLDP
jgi:hypothetical protein